MKNRESIPKLALLLAVCAMFAPLGMFVSGAAAWEKTQKDLLLGTDGIAVPEAPTSDAQPWRGSYVYYGKYNNTPMKYRVLAPNTTEFRSGTDKTMLLDCDSVLTAMQFGSDNQWLGIASKSAVKIWLRGTKDTEFFNDKNFSAQEKAAVALSYKSKPAEGDGDGYGNQGPDSAGGEQAFDFAILRDDTIFVLDAVEATRPSYGYANTPGMTSTRVKKDRNNSSRNWWLRSPKNGETERLCIVDGTENIGCLFNGSATDDSVYVSPAFNVNLSRVIFSSLVSGTLGKPGAEYKLTLADNNLGITQKGAYKNAKKFEAVYDVTGTPDYVSVLMTDGFWKDDLGWIGSGNVKFYSRLSPQNGGESWFCQMPENFDEKWNVYLIAERVNGEKETDYASKPLYVNVKSFDDGITISFINAPYSMKVYEGDTAYGKVEASATLVRDDFTRMELQPEFRQVGKWPSWLTLDIDGTIKADLTSKYDNDGNLIRPQGEDAAEPGKKYNFVVEASASAEGYSGYTQTSVVIEVFEKEKDDDCNAGFGFLALAAALPMLMMKSRRSPRSVK